MTDGKTRVSRFNQCRWQCQWQQQLHRSQRHEMTHGQISPRGLKSETALRCRPGHGKEYAGRLNRLAACVHIRTHGQQWGHCLLHPEPALAESDNV